MKDKAIDSQRFKFLIQWIISQGYFKTQEELGRAFGVNNKSTLSQIINGKQTSLRFVNCVLDVDARINKGWIYGESENMLVENENSKPKIEEDPTMIIELLKKDVKYYADIADSRLETIRVQSKLISQLEEQINTLK